ncbi:MAG: hypothetical protein HRT69_13685 [Flavobacteriaceae bacterium]|nr:hypothetical protein [Flavobacteriaceae bacterium]
MNTYKIITVGIVVLILSSCAAVPRQVVDAMEVQKKEIESIKNIYFENLNNQLDAIEKYRLAILTIYREQYILKHSKTLDMVTHNGKDKLVELKPTGIKNVDHINLGILESIDVFFEKQKQKIKDDIKKRRVQIAKANANFENIEQISLVVNEYLQSLLRLKKSKDHLAKSITSSLQKISPFPISFDVIPNPSTMGDSIKNLKLK